MKTTLRIYVDLDSLLDTRGGTLCRMNEDEAIKLFHNPDYAGRIIDWFPGFDRDEFKKEYAKRDLETLKLSMTTFVPEIIQDFCHRALNRGLNSPFTFEPEVVINTFPFNTSEGLNKAFAQALSERLVPPPKITFMHADPKSLHPSYIKERFNTVVMYDFINWIDDKVEKEELKNVNLAEFLTFFTPALIHKIDKNPPENPAAIFEEIMNELSIVCKLIFIPVDVFSSVLVKRRPPPKESGIEDLTEDVTIDDLDPHWRT